MISKNFMHDISSTIYPGSTKYHDSTKYHVSIMKTITKDTLWSCNSCIVADGTHNITIV